MAADKINIEDLLADESFINYCNHTSAKDEQYWEKLLEINPAQADLAEEAKRILFQLFSALATIDLDEQVALLEKRLGTYLPTP
ncbi:MAG: hypothetical protein ABWZ25_18310 [Chitinophagaceae bacterium]